MPPQYVLGVHMTVHFRCLCCMHRCFEIADSISPKRQGESVLKDLTFVIFCYSADAAREQLSVVLDIEGGKRI